MTFTQALAEVYTTLGVLYTYLNGLSRGKLDTWHVNSIDQGRSAVRDVAHSVTPWINEQQDLTLLLDGRRIAQYNRKTQVRSPWFQLPDEYDLRALLNILTQMSGGIIRTQSTTTAAERNCALTTETTAAVKEHYGPHEDIPK